MPKTIAKIVQAMSPAEAKAEAKSMRAFLADDSSATNPKDWIWLELLQRRAKGKDVA